MRGKTGAARMALEHDIPVIPIAHWGTQDVMARYSKKISFFPRKTIAVKVGDPVDLSGFRGRNLDSATLNEATSVIMSGITALLEDLRGEEAPAVRWNPSQHDQKETGRFEA
jgi:1-acyl-sn-glycerol-3-phosphate acyltransferase